MHPAFLFFKNHETLLRKQEIHGLYQETMQVAEKEGQRTERGLVLLRCDPRKALEK